MKRADRYMTMLPALVCCFLAAVFMLCAAASVLAAPGDALYINPKTGYAVYIDDREDLLTEAEEKMLVTDMIPVTDYGGAAFISGRSLDSKNTYRSFFGTDSGTILLIDMGERWIRIFSDGLNYKYISSKYANLITDNCYSYASRGDYLGCAQKAFGEITRVLSGGRIAQPMRYITNFIAAVVLAFLGNFLYIWVKKKRVKIPKTALITGSAFGMGRAAQSAITRSLIKTRKTRRSESSGSSGGRSGGGFSGGGFSGGSSGGGGGHRF